ncbi:hypothetical protein AD998_01830 [bacterium 336/3]|nr:hypothetical protein AD998_01830 [bacterium 336/3]
MSRLEIINFDEEVFFSDYKILHYETLSYDYIGKRLTKKLQSQLDELVEVTKAPLVEFCNYFKFTVLKHYDIVEQGPDDFRSYHLCFQVVKRIEKIQDIFHHKHLLDFFCDEKGLGFSIESFTMTRYHQ